MAEEITVFDQLRELVDSTIAENGQRQITGKALNLALLEIITAMEENKHEGGGAETVYVEEPLTQEHQAVNAAIYAKCKANVAEDKALPVIVMDVTQMMVAQVGGMSDGVKMLTLSLETAFVDPSSPTVEALGMAGLVCANDVAELTVNEDGSITMIQ